MDSKMDMVCIDEPEDNILCRKLQKFDFPAVTVLQNTIYFNSKCGNILNSEKIRVSKTNDFLIFREAHPYSEQAYRKHVCKGNDGFQISGNRICGATGLKPGEVYRLYNVNGGGYAIKRHEPIQAPD